jgi:y4mF family transcriptional regulator
MKSFLSATLKNLRKEYRLTQQDLSYKSGVGLNFVRQLEQGKPTLRMDKVNQVLALFGYELAPVRTEDLSKESEVEG